MATNKVSKEQTDAKSPIDAGTESWQLRALNGVARHQQYIITEVTTVGREESCGIYLPSGHISRLHARLSPEGERLVLTDMNSANGTYVNGEKISEQELQHDDVVRFDTLEFVVVAPEVHADTNKTQLRMPVVSSDDVTLVTDADKLAGDFNVMSSGKTEVGRAWAEQKKETGKDVNGTMVMPDVSDVCDGTVAMPAVESEQTREADCAEMDNTVVARLVCRMPPMEGKVFTLSQKLTTIGRDDTNDVVLAEASVSSVHAHIRYEQGRWTIEDKGSYNGVYVNNTKRQRAELRTGDEIGIGRVQLRFEDPAQKPARSLFRMPSVKLPVLQGNVLLSLAAASLAVVAVAAALLLWPRHKVSLYPLWVSSPVDMPDPMAPVVADVNADAKPEVLVVSGSGKVDILSAAAGAVVQTLDSVGPINAPPLVLDVNNDGKRDIVLSSVNGTVVAVSGDGREIWRKSPAENDQLVSAPATAAINDDRVEDIIMPSATASLLAMDGASGNMLWSAAGTGIGPVFSKPLVADVNSDGLMDIVVIGNRDRLISLTLINGQLRKNWTQPIPKVLSATPLFVTSPSATGMIVLATQEDGIIAFNASNGARLWQIPVEDLVLADLLVADSKGNGRADSIIAADLSGNVISIDTVTGEILWQTKLEAGVQAAPQWLPSEGETGAWLLIADTKANVYILAADNGGIVDKTAVEGADHFVVPAVVADLDGKGREELLLVSQNGRRFAYRIE